MAVGRITPAGAVQLSALLVVLVWAGGCQTGPQVSSRRLIEHQAMVDFSGLKPASAIEPLQTTLGVPARWNELPIKATALYTHQQWKSPSGHTGIGVVFCHLPLPLSARTVVWLAKREYAKQAEDGRVIDEWVDELGRSWFEAENNKYHVRGYVVVKGFSAWITYFGYRTQYPPEVSEIALAARAAESAAPLTDGDPPATAVGFDSSAAHQPTAALTVGSAEPSATTQPATRSIESH